MIRTRLEDGVGVVTLARGEVRNALTPAMLAGLAEAIGQAGDRSRCVLIEGEGRVFCAGFDLALCMDSADGAVMRELLEGLDRAVRAMRASPAPVVVACQGAAIAGGCALVAGADFAVVDRGAKLGYPVVVLGVSPAVSGPTLVPQTGAGPARVRMLDPGLIDGREAVRVGLASDLVAARDDVGPAAVALSRALASKGRGAIEATKRWLGELDGTGSAGSSGLEASLGLTGGEEERELLARFWAGRSRAGD